MSHFVCLTCCLTALYRFCLIEFFSNEFNTLDFENVQKNVNEEYSTVPLYLLMQQFGGRLLLMKTKKKSKPPQNISHHSPEGSHIRTTCKQFFGELFDFFNANCGVKLIVYLSISMRFIDCDKLY